MYETALRALDELPGRSPEPSTPCGNAGLCAMTASAPDVIGTRTKPLPTEAMSGEPNDANASALVCSGCCTHAASPQAPPGGNARIPLGSFEIEGLIRLKVLPKAHR